LELLVVTREAEELQTSKSMAETFTATASLTKQHGLLLKILEASSGELTKHQRQALFILWKREEPLTNEERGFLWMKATGSLVHIENPMN